jgi:hypothetical protein
MVRGLAPGTPLPLFALDVSLEHQEIALGIKPFAQSRPGVQQRFVGYFGNDLVVTLAFAGNDKAPMRIGETAGKIPFFLGALFARGLARYRFAFRQERRKLQCQQTTQELFFVRMALEEFLGTRTEHPTYVDCLRRQS